MKVEATSIYSFFHYRDGDFYDDDEFYEDDYDGYVNLLRHEFCFDEFKGYGDEYEGPKGVLTSYLPDGTSVTVTNGSIDNGSQGIVFCKHLR